MGPAMGRAILQTPFVFHKDLSVGDADRPFESLTSYSKVPYLGCRDIIQLGKEYYYLIDSLFKLRAKFKFN